MAEAESSRGRGIGPFRDWREVTLAVTLVLGVLVMGATLYLGVSHEEDPSEATSPPTDRPTNVELFDVAGTDAPEFVKIDDEVLAYQPTRVSPLWEPFVPFFATLLAAMIAAAAAIFPTVYSARRHEEHEKRLAALEQRAAGGD
jgi:hypothetical protein